MDAAVAAAKEAFPEWSARSPEERAKVLHKLADLIEANLEEFARAESKDQGKSLFLAEYKMPVTDLNQTLIPEWLISHSIHFPSLMINYR